MRNTLRYSHACLGSVVSVLFYPECVGALWVVYMQWNGMVQVLLFYLGGSCSRFYIPLPLARLPRPLALLAPLGPRLPLALPRE
jgi:hypothetical protein